MPAQRVFERQDWRFGGEKFYEIRPEQDADRKAAEEIASNYDLADIQLFLREGNVLLRSKGKDLKEYRIHAIRRTMMHGILAIGSIFSEQCGMRIERERSLERTIQVEPARIFRTLQILDIAERILKEQRGDWVRI